MKTCPRCSTAKPHDEFYLRNGKPSSYCKPCHKDYYRKRYADRDSGFRTAVLARQATERVRHRRAERLYGLAEGDLARLLADQRGLCAICDEPLTPPCVDHDHLTGRVRGLLCHACNRGTGLLGDDPARLRSAADYLERTP